MKKCPECGREYDTTMMFCLDDGAELLYGPASTDEPKTAILSEPGAIATGIPAGDATRPQINTTDQTAFFPNGAEAEPQKNLNSTEKHSFSAHRAAKPLAALIVSVGVLVGGFFGYRYFNSANSERIDSIAVLPFENRSGSADTDYLSDGLAESLIYRLTQLPGLKVSPTSTVLRYKGSPSDVATIAKELEVDAIMSGRVAQRGDDLTISVELIDARTKKLIWAEQYDRKMADLLATQREIATTITQKLELKLSGNDARGITKKYTDSNDAYQLYMRGRHAFGKRTKDEMLRAIEYFQQAVKLDPKFGLAYARISETYGSMPAYPYLSPKEAFPEAKAAAQRALELDPTLAEAHTFLAYSLVIYDWNWAEAEPLFKRAIELDPNNVSAHFRYGQIYLASVGRLDEGLAEIKRGHDGEPLDINMGGALAWGYIITGQKDKALELARKNYELEPNHPIARWSMIDAYVENGMYKEAISVGERWLQADPGNQFALRGTGIAYAMDSRRDKAEEMIRRLRDLAKTQYVPTGRYAAVYAALGDKDKAFEELNTAFEERDWEVFRFNADHYWIPLRDDPRYNELVKRLNLPK